MSSYTIPARAAGATSLLLMLLFTACGGEASDSQDAAQAAADQVECDPDNGGLVLPDGFCGILVAEDVGPARHLAVRDNGDIFVKLRQPDEGGGLVALRDTTADGRADVVQRFGDFGGTGIGFHDGYLYASSDTAVYRYPLTSEALVPDAEPEVIVRGFPDQGTHAAKPFAIDGENNLYVNVGAPSNACQQQARAPGSPGMDPCPQLERHAGIWRFDADQPGQTQQGDGAHFATGTRHIVALAYDDATAQLYGVIHGRDQLDTLWPEHFSAEDNAELPAEEFVALNEGDDYGWPYCYYDGREDQRVLAPEYGGDGTEVGRCDQYPDPLVALPAHWAPNALTFYDANSFPQQYHGGAFIAFHGSWNRAPLPQGGYNVVFVPFEGGAPTGEWETFASGFADEQEFVNVSEAEHRPCGVAVGPDGSLYVSDSREGDIWRILYRG